MLTSDQEVKESVKEGGGIVLIWGVDEKLTKMWLRCNFTNIGQIKVGKLRKNNLCGKNKKWYNLLSINPKF